MPDHFERLGLPRCFSIDLAMLERAYLAQSRAVHPDFHLAGSDAALAASLEASAAANEAYNVLRDPFTRADYLLTLEGGPSASEHRQMPSAFLAEMLDAREQIEAARGNDAATATLEQDFQQRFDALMTQVGDHLTKAIELPTLDAKRANLLTQTRGLLNAAKYVRGLLNDLHGE
jgi:molecular chaperone HscB